MQKLILVSFCMPALPKVRIITLCGKETAVLVSIAEWQRLHKAQPNLKSLLLTPSPTELDISERVSQQRRTNESCLYFFHEHVT